MFRSPPDWACQALLFWQLNLEKENADDEDHAQYQELERCSHAGA
jgi:hypothetical protein